MRIEALKIADLPAKYKNTITVKGGITVRIVKQRTGFGRRRYFLCPNCDRKCSKLHHVADQFYCQRCIPFDLYGYRRSLYDENTQRLITWHMMKLALKISDSPIEYPFRYWNYPIDPPAGISRRKYRETLMKLQILENMRFAAFAHGARYAAADIRRYTGKSFINLFELWQVAEFQIFGTDTPPEYYAFLLDMDAAEPMIADYHVGPIHIKFR